MTRTLSASARAKKTEALRQDFPYLEKQLDAFRENGFQAEDVMAYIKDAKAGIAMPGKTAHKYSALEDDQKTRLRDAAEAITDGYAEFFETRRSNGVELKAKDALEGLEGDIHKICNFSHATPFHKARQGIETYLLQQEKGLDSSVAPEEAPAHTEEVQPAKNILNSGDTRKLAATAGAIAGVGAAAEAAKSWRERVKNPDSRKRAITFASVAAVSAVGVAASLFLGRSNGGVSR